MKNLVFFKTHYIDDAVTIEYKKLSNSISDNNNLCLLFIDNHNKFIKNPSFNSVYEMFLGNNCTKVVEYNETVHKEMQFSLYTDNPNNQDLGKVMWYNCDYPFYIVRKYFPNFNYYWSIESDVFCNGSSYSPFFGKYSDNNSDLIIKDYRIITSDSNWYWKHNEEWCYENTQMYAGLFPVVRLSAKAVDFLYKKRLEYAAVYENLLSDNQCRWPFCELFVPTELSNNNFKCINLDEPNIRYKPVYNLNKERIFEHPDFMLYHPVK